MNKENGRPGEKGENKANQYIYIGLFGYKACGKPVCVECTVKLSNGYKVLDPDKLPVMPCCVGCRGE